MYDLYKERRTWFDCPGERYGILMFIGAPARYVVHRVVSTTLGEVAAAMSTQRLSLIAGKYVGKDDLHDHAGARGAHRRPLGVDGRRDAPGGMTGCRGGADEGT